jgi:hypothetical protein
MRRSRRPCRLWSVTEPAHTQRQWRCGFYFQQSGRFGRRLAGLTRWLFPGAETLTIGNRLPRSTRFRNRPVRIMSCCRMRRRCSEGVP